MFFKHHQWTFETKPVWGDQKHQCAQLVFLVFVFCIRSGFCCLTTKARLLQKNSGFRVFFCSIEVVHKTVCTIFVQLVFLPPKNRAQKRALFSKTTLPYRNSGFRAKYALKTLSFEKCIVLWHSNLQLVKQVFWCCWKEDTLWKTYVYSAFFETQCRKKTQKLPLLTKTRNILGKMMNKKKEVTNWAKNRKQKNTNWHQNLSQKSSKTHIFVVRKWSPQELVLFLTLEVVLFLTLERLKRGTKTNSPAYIYI